MKQKFKNMWVEWRYGFKYYDFPWEIKSKVHAYYLRLSKFI